MTKFQMDAYQPGSAINVTGGGEKVREIIAPLFANPRFRFVEKT